MIISGYEVRKILEKEEWLSLVHLQDENFLRYTVMVTTGVDPRDMYQGLIDRADPGTSVLVESSVKRFSTWQTTYNGIGKVRGHSMTYHKHYGIQVWTFMEVELKKEGIRNIAVLSGESSTPLQNSQEVKEVWGGTTDYVRDRYNFGSMWVVEYDKRKRKHEIVDKEPHAPYNGDEFFNSPQSEMDTKVCEELSESPVG
jgi:hypothetical protein